MLDSLIERVSGYPRLCRIVALVLRWKHRGVSERDLRARAELALIRESQRGVTVKERFKKLCPTKGDDSIWRINGRVSSGQMIVTGLLAERLVSDIHHTFGHMSVDYVLSVLRERYWVVLSTVRKVVKKCVLCQKERTGQIKQNISEIPDERLRCHEPPFCVTGIDCFGPYEFKYKLGTLNDTVQYLLV